MILEIANEYTNDATTITTMMRELYPNLTLKKAKSRFTRIINKLDSLIPSQPNTSTENKLTQ